MEELSQEEKEIIKAYRRLVKETNSKNWIICNPEMMWSTYFVSISLIEKKIEEYNDILEYAETEEGLAEIKDFEYDEAKYGKKILQELLDERNNTDE